MLCYQFRVKGLLDKHWTDLFSDLTITLTPENETLLTGPVVDQASLYGILNNIRSIGLTLVSVNLLPAEIQ